MKEPEKKSLKDIRFLGSFPNYTACPEKGLPEIAFIGRSNVGKSSLINMLTGIKDLARTSSTPGKTLLINYFLVEQRFALIDLPGYGFAKISKTVKEKIKKLVSNYLVKSEQLQCVLLLIDIRHERQESDKQFMEWLANEGIPFVLVFTKADKLTSNQVKRSVSDYMEKMKEEWEETPVNFVTSAKTSSGKEALIEFILSLIPGTK